ncbi:putative membrane protein, partial [Rhodococcus opacus RKJ300 = JCM 13270]
AQDEAEVAHAGAPPAPRQEVAAAEAPTAGAPDAAAATGAAVTAPTPGSVTTPEELVSGLRAAAEALPYGAPEPAPLSAVFEPRLSAATARAMRARSIGGGGRIPPPRPIDPIEIDPVPKATEAITVALNKRLPEVPMPAIKPMPDDSVPVLGPVEGVGKEELQVEVPVTQPDAGRADTGKVNATEAARAKAATAKAAVKTPVPEPEAAPVVPPVILDVRRDPPPPLLQAHSALEGKQVARVRAIVLSSVPEKADSVTQAYGEMAFPPKGMRIYCADITEAMRGEIKKELGAEMEVLFAAANVAQDDLTAAVEERDRELKAHQKHVAAEAELVLQKTAATLDAKAQKEIARIEAAKRREEAEKVQRLRLALHSRKPELVEELVEKRFGYIRDDIGKGVVAIEAARDRRVELLKIYQAAYLKAYRKADDAFQERKPIGQRRPANLGSKLWYDVAVDELAVAMKQRNEQVAFDAKGLVDELQKAGLAARTALREWADRRLRRDVSADETQRRAAADASTQEGEIVAARTQAEQDGVRNRLLGDIRFASAAYLRVKDEDNKVCADRAAQLDARQMAVARVFLAAGDKDDPMSAVAAMLVGRYQQKHEKERVASLREQVLKIVPTTKAVASDLAELYFPDGSGALSKRVLKLRAAFEVWHGTAESDVISALTGVDGPAMKLLNQTYQLTYNESLQWRIGAKMSGSDYDQAAGLAGNDGGPRAAEARKQHARGVIADSDGIFSNDPNRALDAIRNLPPGEADDVVKDKDVREHLTTVLGGRRWLDKKGSVADDRGERELQILLDINRVQRKPGEPAPPQVRDLQARIDAIEFDRWIRRGTDGDAPGLDQIFARIRAQVLADPATSAWSAEEVDNEVRRRTAAMENAYEKEFGAELPGGGESALHTAMARNLWGTRRELAIDLLTVNRAGERATRLQRTTEGLYTSDSEMNAELERTYNDALAEVRRADSCREQVEKRAQELMQKDGITAGGRRPAPTEIEAYRREATEEIARELAAEWMKDVSKTFGDRYAWRWGGKAEDALRYMVKDTTQFSGEREALARLANGGGLTAAQAVQYGVAGRGIERDPIVGALSGRTKQQLARISADYKTNTGGEDMVSRLQSETGDWSWKDKDTSLERDGFDIREALRGVPTTAEEEHAAITRRFEYERDVYFKNNPAERKQAVGPELAILQEAYDRANQKYAAYQSAVGSGDQAAIRRAEAAVGDARAATNIVADHYREAVDAYVDRTAQIAAVAAAVTVAVLITVATGGTAGPVIIGLAASLAGTAATIANKQSILGAAYSRHALTNDLIVGVVDAVVTVLTARLGNILLKLPKPTGATEAALAASVKAIEKQQMAKPLLHRAAAFAAEQMAQSVPSAVTGAMLERSTWRGDPLKNVATSAGMAAAIGIGVGAAVHGVSAYGPKVLGAAVDHLRMLRSGSGAEIAADRVLLRSTAESLTSGEIAGDALAHRGSPMERLAARREYLKQFPGKTVADFDKALAEGTAEAVASAEAVREARREMTKHFLDGIPAAERGKYASTPIIVMPDAEFTARTGSAEKGHAVTLVVDGEPIVVIREGAPLSALREEGLHARQIKDAVNAERVALLDERRLAEWASTSLEDRVKAWHAKLDLELEAQAKLMKDLDDELAKPDLSPQRAAELAERFDDAQSAFEVLSQRRSTLLDLDGGGLERIRSGSLEPPDFLAEEPRLFAKKGKGRAEPKLLAWMDADPVETKLPDGNMRVDDVPFKEGSRWSRWVSIYDSSGQLVDKVLERMVSTNTWQKSGQVGRWGGGVAEIAMKIDNARRVTDYATGGGVKRMKIDNARRVTDYATGGGVKRVQLDAQTAGGQGFDDVMPEFRKKGKGVEAVIVVGEGKSYTSSAVNDFSAIDTNFEKNLQRFREKLVELSKDGKWVAAGMTEQEVKAAIDAVDANRVRVEVRTSEATRIAAGKLDEIEKRLQKKFGKQVTVKPGDPIPARDIAEAESWFMTMERYRLERRKGGDIADGELFRSLAQRPNGISPASIEVAEAVIFARKAKLLDAGNVRWEPGGRFMLDAKGQPLHVEVLPQQTTFDPDATARQVLATAQRSVPVKGSGATVPMRVLLDLGSLTPQQQIDLQEALARLATKSSADRAAYQRVVQMGVPEKAKVDPK